MSKDGNQTRLISSCPVCDKDKFESRPIELSFRLPGPSYLKSKIQRCSNCGHRHLQTTTQDQKLIERKYDANYAGYRQDENFRLSCVHIIEEHLHERLNDGAKVLDVGCGNGIFLLELSRKGYDVSGLDISDYAVEVCQKLGLDVRSDDFLKQKGDVKYDLISMWDVIEHVRNPLDFLNQSKSMLDKDGVLFIKVPTFYGFSFTVLRFFGRLSGKILGAPDHVQYFTKESLRTVLARAEFKEVQIVSAGSVRKKAKAKTLGKVLGRLVGKTVKFISGNENLLVFAKVD